MIYSPFARYLFLRGKQLMSPNYFPLMLPGTTTWKIRLIRRLDDANIFTPCELDAN